MYKQLKKFSFKMKDTLIDRVSKNKKYNFNINLKQIFTQPCILKTSTY